jgi:hypothetical protein
MWISLSPLEPEPWFEDSMDDFAVESQAAAANDLELTIGTLGNTRERDLNAWLDLHAQNTGTFRSALYGTEQLSGS